MSGDEPQLDVLQLNQGGRGIAWMSEVPGLGTLVGNSADVYHMPDGVGSAFVPILDGNDLRSTESRQSLVTPGLTERATDRTETKRPTRLVVAAGCLAVAAVLAYGIKSTNQAHSVTNSIKPAPKPIVVAPSHKPPEVAPHIPTPEEIAAAQKATAISAMKADPITGAIKIPQGYWVEWMPDEVRVWYPTIMQILNQKRIAGDPIDPVIKYNPQLIEMIILYESGGNPLADGIGSHQGLSQLDHVKEKQILKSLPSLSNYNPYLPKDNLTALIALLNKQAIKLRNQGTLTNLARQAQAAATIGDSAGYLAAYEQQIRELMPGIATNQFHNLDALLIEIPQLASESSWTTKDAKAFRVLISKAGEQAGLTQAAKIQAELGFKPKFKEVKASPTGRTVRQ